MANNQNFSKQSLILAFLNLAEIFGMDQIEFCHSLIIVCNEGYLVPN